MQYGEVCLLNTKSWEWESKAFSTLILAWQLICCTVMCKSIKYSICFFHLWSGINIYQSFENSRITEKLCNNL